MTPETRPSAFFELTPDDLTDFCRQHDLPYFLGTQLREWVYDKGVTDPENMTNISGRNCDVLVDHMIFEQGSVTGHQCDSDGTQKLLIDWDQSPTKPDLPLLESGAGRETESVMIPTDTRKTACVSSQIGCPVGCTFCASGLGGSDGNLSAGMIVEQIHRLNHLEGVGRITNVVFMGMGEPLANFSAVTSAIRTINAPWGYGISARKITVSTVGLPGAIRKLVDFEIPVTLALSLHAPNDEIRRTLIPWADYATIDELIDACHEYFQKTGREITLEYLLLRGINDRIEHARELAHTAKNIRANVNLIRYNEVPGLPYERPRTEDVRRFQETLRKLHINTHIRASRGRNIAAACGQLRHESRREIKPA